MFLNVIKRQKTICIFFTSTKKKKMKVYIFSVTTCIINTSILYFFLIKNVFSFLPSQYNFFHLLQISTSSNNNDVTQPKEDELSIIQIASSLQNKIDFMNNLNENENDNFVDIMNNEERKILIRKDIESIIYQMEDIYFQEGKKNNNNNITTTINTIATTTDNENNEMYNESVLPKRFQPALGLYNVIHVQTKQKDENPVGGKWTRKNKFITQNLVSTKRIMQHLLLPNTTTLGNLQINCSSSLVDDGVKKDMMTMSKNEELRPVVAEAVNVITLEALWKVIHLSIILRGDAVPLSTQERNSSSSNNEKKNAIKGPLSNLAVRAYFDRPRIVLGERGRFSFSLGPKSSVVLDTTYLDEVIRIGKGGTSGTRFIFKRCANDDREAEDFKSLLLMKSIGKAKLSSFLLVLVAGSGILGNRYIGSKIVSRSVSAVLSILFLAVLFSTGGIERDQEPKPVQKDKETK